MRFGFLVLAMMAMVAGSSLAAESKRAGWQPGEVLPQDRPLPATLQALADDAEKLYSADVVVHVGLKSENPAWELSQTNLPILLEKMLALHEAQPSANDALSMKAKYSEPAYKGLELRIARTDGKAFETLHVYNGRVLTRAGRLVAGDPGRKLEYWLWGTARIKREVVMGARIMPVLTFEQCRLMGQEVVDSLPRQCLLPDGDLLLDVKEPLTATSLKAKDFDGCLRHGVGIINTFPRRCVMPGGRVFVEPPRLIETPADAPLAEGVSSGLPVAVTPTGSVPSRTSVVVPGVGNFTVSTSTVNVLPGAAVVSASMPAALVTSTLATPTVVPVSVTVPVTATVVVPGVSVAVVVTGTAVMPAVASVVPVASMTVPASFTSGADLKLGH